MKENEDFPRERVGRRVKMLRGSGLEIEMESNGIQSNRKVRNFEASVLLDHSPITLLSD